MQDGGSTASRIDHVTPEVLHWTLQDQRIDFRGDAYALVRPGGTILIDPLPLTDDAIDRLGTVAAICLTGEQHQRYAWILRRQLGVPVHAPDGTTTMEESADHLYSDGQKIAGELLAHLAPACIAVHHAFLAEGTGAGRILFCGDVVMREGNGPFFLMPDYFVHDRSAIRESARKLADLHPEALCPSHGLPLASGGESALRDALRRAGD